MKLNNLEKQIQKLNKPERQFNYIKAIIYTWITALSSSLIIEILDLLRII